MAHPEPDSPLNCDSGSCFSYQTIHYYFVEQLHDNFVTSRSNYSTLLQHSPTKISGRYCSIDQQLISLRVCVEFLISKKDEVTFDITIRVCLRFCGYLFSFNMILPVDI
jgi:hypothetical protein